MVVDTSAILAILLREPEEKPFLKAMEAAASVRMSAVTAVEVSMVVESRAGPEGVRELDLFLTKVGVELVPVDAGHCQWARVAFSRFGKGRHRARLNLGDCF